MFLFGFLITFSFFALTIVHNSLYSYPVNLGGTVLITDAALGPSREAAIYLSSLGLHVLAGVKTDYEAKSFSFDERKGLETIIMDINEPATVANALYRIKEIRRDLNRDLFGVVISNKGLSSNYSTF